jgi:prepilin-type N-terminal cleavage/methylation domain-containing protein
MTKRKGFTLLEAVFVLVVVAILGALAVPKLEPDRRQEAADNILSAIRYTQHLALVDDKQAFNDAKWQRKFWRIQIERCSDGAYFYSIGSDSDEGGDIDMNEAALDPTNGKPMFWTNTSACKNGGDDTVSRNIFLTRLYGVTGFQTSGGCANVQHIGFDHLGRPHVGFTNSTRPNNASYMQNVCSFTFTLEGEDDFTITIQPETGYAAIAGQEHS